MEDRVVIAVSDALFSDPTPERTARLARSARGVSFGDVWHRLESHGVLPLVHRNLGLAGIELTADDDALVRPRREALRQDASVTRVTIERLVAAAREADLELILLKGASLADDVHPDPGLRSQGDVDILVRSKDVARAVDLLGRIGCFVHEDRMPMWWYRWSHFHVKVTPALPLMRELEVHWHLHAPSLLSTVDIESLWARSAPCRGGPPIFHLDAADRFLHLVTHLASHGLGDAPETFDTAVRHGIATEAPAVRFKWWVDLVAVADRIRETVPPQALRERAREWNVQTTLDGIGAALATSRLLESPTQTWLRGSCRSASPSIARGTNVAGDRPLPGLDVRGAAVRRRLPRWIVPDATYFRRRHGDDSGIFRHRVVHGASVIGFLGLSALLLPVAWVGHLALRRRRRARRRRWSTPERVLDLVAAGRGSPESA